MKYIFQPFPLYMNPNISFQNSNKKKLRKRLKEYLQNIREIIQPSTILSSTIMRIVVCKDGGSHSGNSFLVQYQKFSKDCQGCVVISSSQYAKHLWFNVRCFVIYIITIFPSTQLKYGDKGLESLPACNLISNVLENCFDENECYSQREMDYGRNLIAAYYIHNMNSLRVTFINC